MIPALSPYSERRGAASVSSFLQGRAAGEFGHPNVSTANQKLCPVHDGVKAAPSTNAVCSTNSASEINKANKKRIQSALCLPRLGFQDEKGSP